MKIYYSTTKSKWTYLNFELSIMQFLKTASLNNICNIVLSYKADISAAAYHCINY